MPAPRTARPEGQVPANPASVGEAYEAPHLDRLGTLAELTLGGVIGPDDGIDGAGDEGSLN